MRGLGFRIIFPLILRYQIMDSMVKRTKAVPSELLGKEYLSQFKIEEDVSKVPQGFGRFAM